MAEVHGSQYSPSLAFIYIFNLVVGTGILALPSVLMGGGWILGGIFLLLVSFLSYVTVTFMLESMATANALLRLLSKTGIEEDIALIEASEIFTESSVVNNDTRLLPSQSERELFQISKRTELGEMAGLFFNQWGIICFYCALILYLFGDSVIYSTVVARSLVEFFSGSMSAAPWAFDLCLVIFLVFSLPFCFFDFQKTKSLQITTMAIRNVALYTMIILAILRVAKRGHLAEEVPSFNISALPNLFGGAVYSFMCHHSLPGIITPMQDKSHALRIAAMSFVSVIVIYMLLFISCGLAFEYGVVGDALVLFPVFTLSSNFPMLSITLRNNLEILYQLLSQKARHGSMELQPTVVTAHQAKHAESGWQIFLTLVAVVPPTLFSFIAEHADISVDALVGLTGAFAGCAVMFIIPASLVYCSRKVFEKAYTLVRGAHQTKATLPKNYHASPFRGQGWVFLILAWAGIAILFNAFEMLSKFSS